MGACTRTRLWIPPQGQARRFPTSAIAPALLSAGGAFAYAAKDGPHRAAASTVSVLGTPWTVVAEQAEGEAVSAVDALSRTLTC